MRNKIVLIIILILLVSSIFVINSIVRNQRNKTDQQDKTNNEISFEHSKETDQGSQSPTQEGTKTEAVQDSGEATYKDLFDNTLLHKFKIVITKGEWDGLSEDMLDIKSVDNSMRTGNYRKADLYYSDGNNEVILGEIGVRTKGNTSRVLPETEEGLHRFNFKLKFDETFDIDENSPQYDQRKDREMADVSELNFKAHTGTDPSNIREVFSYEVMNAFGITAPKASLAVLTIVIDGVEHDFGVVRYMEEVDKGFFTKRLGKDNNDGNLYKCLWQNYGPASLMPITDSKAIGIKEWEENYRPTYDRKTNEGEDNFEDLKDFIKQINELDGEEFAAYLEEHFNIDQFLRVQAMDVMLGHIDGYRSMGNNYYLYFDEKGTVEWIPFDYDNILAGGWDGDPHWSYEGIATADIMEWKNMNNELYHKETTHPLIDKLLEIDKYREIYLNYLSELSNAENNYFAYDRYLELYHQLYDIYGDEVDNEMQEGNVWELTKEEWYFSTKVKSVKEQLSVLGY